MSMGSTEQIGHDGVFLKRGRREARLLHHALIANRPLLALALLQTVIAIGVARLYGITYSNGMLGVASLMILTLMPVYLLVILIWRIAVLASANPGVRPVPLILDDLRDNMLDAPRLLSGVVAMGALFLFFGGFSFLKDAIPAINPFDWDPYFAQLDRAIHGGDPGSMLMQVIGTPLVTTAINAAYHFWFFLLYFFVFVACFTGVNPAARRRFLLAFVFTWSIGGNLLATIFSSGGPVFYGPLGLGNDFEPLMQTLRGFHEISPVWALRVQDLLWESYTVGGTISGISAMPSMHVASTTLMTLYAFSWNRIAGWAMTAFLTLIMLGSVLLGWHYAIDGYAGAAVAAAAWFGVPHLTGDRRSKRDSQTAKYRSAGT